MLFSQWMVKKLFQLKSSPRRGENSFSSSYRSTSPSPARRPGEPGFTSMVRLNTRSSDGYTVVGGVAFDGAGTLASIGLLRG